MTRLSLQPAGGLAMDAPSLNPCTISSLTDAEAELWNLFHQFSPSLLKTTTLPGIDPSSASSPKSVCFDLSEHFRHWLQSFFYDDHCYEGLQLNPDLKRRILVLVSKVLCDQKPTVGGCHDDGACFLKRNGIVKPVCSIVSDALKRCHSLPDMLTWLKKIAISPYEPVISAAASAWRIQILKTRYSLFLTKTESSFDAQYPYPCRKRRRFDRSLSLPSATILSNKKHASSAVPIQPARRSKRFLGMLKFGENNGRRKRVPVDSSFQAHVPEWSGPPSESDQLDDERWLGTKIWMLDNDGRDFDNWMIGKGRPSSCVCTYPGSVACIRFHVEIARIQLKFDLGSAFFGWGFGEMGEDVSKSWTSEEQQTFDTIMRLHSLSEYMDFLEPALKAFPSKTKRSIVSYYFNVFVLRRMSKLTRFASGSVDSDDDGNDSEVLQVLHSTHSQRRKKSA